MRKKRSTSLEPSGWILDGFWQCSTHGNQLRHSHGHSCLTSLDASSWQGRDSVVLHEPMGTGPNQKGCGGNTLSTVFPTSAEIRAQSTVGIWFLWSCHGCIHKHSRNRLLPRGYSTSPAITFLLCGMELMAVPPTRGGHSSASRPGICRPPPR